MEEKKVRLCHCNQNHNKFKITITVYKIITNNNHFNNHVNHENRNNQDKHNYHKNIITLISKLIKTPTKQNNIISSTKISL